MKIGRAEELIRSNIEEHKHAHFLHTLLPINRLKVDLSETEAEKNALLKKLKALEDKLRSLKTG